MTLFFADDMTSKVDEWEMFLNKHNEYIDENDLWSLARCFDKPPHIGNLYTSKLLYRIMSILNEEYNVPMDNMDMDINAICSHFYVDEERIDTLEDFDDVIERYSKDH